MPVITPMEMKTIKKADRASRVRMELKKFMLYAWIMGKIPLVERCFFLFGPGFRGFFFPRAGGGELAALEGMLGEERP